MRNYRKLVLLGQVSAIRQLFPAASMAIIIFNFHKFIDVPQELFEVSQLLFAPAGTLVQSRASLSSVLENKVRVAVIASEVTLLLSNEGGVQIVELGFTHCSNCLFDLQKLGILEQFPFEILLLVFCIVKFIERFKAVEHKLI